MGVQHLRELLDLVHAQGASATVATVRPCAVKQYYAGEAQRLAANAAADDPEKVWDRLGGDGMPRAAVAVVSLVGGVVQRYLLFLCPRSCSCSLTT